MTRALLARLNRVEAKQPDKKSETVFICANDDVAEKEAEIARLKTEGMRVFVIRTNLPFWPQDI